MLIRVRSVKFVPLIADNLTFPGIEMREVFLEHLVYAMERNPDSVLVLAEVEDKEINGFVIAHNPGPKHPFVDLAQVWIALGQPWSVGNQMLSRVVLWSLSLGKSYVRGETQRNPDALLRKFGFEPVSQIVKFTLDPALEQAVVSQSSEAIRWAVSSNRMSKKAESGLVDLPQSTPLPTGSD